MAAKQKKENLNETNVRGQLNIERIVQVAMELLNKEGIDQLSMRKLAEALGIKAASLYWYIKDKAELLQLLSDEISSRIQFPDANLPWQEQVIESAKEYRTAMLGVRDSAEVLMDTVPFTPVRLRQIDRVYSIFDNAGFSPDEVILAANFVNNYVLSFVMDELYQIQTAKEQGISIDQLYGMGNQIFANLPKEQYPSIVKISAHEQSVDKEQEFLFGIQIMIAGLEKRLKEQKGKE